MDKEKNFNINVFGRNVIKMRRLMNFREGVKGREGAPQPLELVCTEMENFDKKNWVVIDLPDSQHL